MTLVEILHGTRGSAGPELTLQTEPTFSKVGHARDERLPSTSDFAGEEPLSFREISCLSWLSQRPRSFDFRPHRISFESLLNGGDSVDASAFVKALTESGMVSITDIPRLASTRDESLSGLDACLSKSKAAQEHVFPDGTQRLTLATHSVPGGIQKVQHKIVSEACASFDEASDSFRATVASVTQSFADRVTEYFKSNSFPKGSNGNEIEKSPLLSTANGIHFNTFSEVVEYGEHLEHFHSYTKCDQQVNKEEETIELHVDQGLFIAFTPGRMMHDQQDTSATLTSGFFIETTEGQVEEVEFDHQDDLVFMLGDGVNQYINDKLDTDKRVRAVPHMLRFKSNDCSSTRVWYGRMVLPPVDALHPAHGTTFGELRERMIAASHANQENENAGLGCSGGMVARDLSETTCHEDSTYCWHRCMNHTDFGFSEESCQSRNLQALCINPRMQIWSGENHGDYFPACGDPQALEEETPFPTLPDYPRSEEVCTDAEFAAFANSTGYDFVTDLPVGGRFMWSIEEGTVRGRIAYNGLFGWLAFGFADVGGLKNGMHGANIIMALPGGNYTAFSGLDLSQDPNVAEYEIHPTESTFRLWNTPLDTTNKDNQYDAESTECFTAMTFQTGSIGNYTFNLDGTDELIWAAHGETAFVNYHGDKSRSRFAIDWTTGEVTLPAKTQEEQGQEDDNKEEQEDDHNHEEDEDTPSFDNTSKAAETNTMTVFVVSALSSIISVAFKL